MTKNSFRNRRRQLMNRNKMANCLRKKESNANRYALKRCINYTLISIEVLISLSLFIPVRRKTSFQTLKNFQKLVSYVIRNLHT